MSIKHIHIQNKRVGYTEETEEIIRLRDNSKKILAWYNKATNRTYRANGDFYAKGNLIMSFLTL